MAEGTSILMVVVGEKADPKLMERTLRIYGIDDVGSHTPMARISMTCTGGSLSRMTIWENSAWSMSSRGTSAIQIRGTFAIDASRTRFSSLILIHRILSIRQRSWNAWCHSSTKASCHSFSCRLGSQVVPEARVPYG